METGYAVIGLGYVGLPVALALARNLGPVCGFDLSTKRIEELRRGFDRTREVDHKELAETTLNFTADPEALRNCSFFIITVPTPIDGQRRPDLGPIRAACHTVGKALRPGGLVVVESTVYPGLTKEICGPALAAASGLRAGIDFHLGYSPERINPGDHTHRLETIVKVVSADDDASLERVAAVYGSIVHAGIHRAPSIEVAEAAKVIENTQRDLNIALMNELAIIFDRLGVSTRDVLAAAGTKWNFLPFTPGLVGGHCIGVDPYYLTAKAESIGYHPHVILSGRRINDEMGTYVAQRLVKMLIAADRSVRHARVGILGVTFKENVPDTRNSRVPQIVTELQSFGIAALVHDPLAEPGDVMKEYGLTLSGWGEFKNLDALVLAVPHAAFLMRPSALFEALTPGGAVLDVKSALNRADIPGDVTYWSL